MNTSELRKKDPSELQDEIYKLAKNQFGLNMQKNSGELKKTHLFKNNRREIARLKTILAELKNKG